MALYRKEAHQQLLSRGAIVKRTVTKKTDYLIRGDKPGAKLDKAIALGVPVLSEREFLTMLLL